MTANSFIRASFRPCGEPRNDGRSSSSPITPISPCSETPSRSLSCGRRTKRASSCREVRLTTHPHRKRHARCLKDHAKHFTAAPASMVCRTSGAVGCVATFKKKQESDGSGRPSAVSCSHLEQLVDELNLSQNIRTSHPPHLPLPDPVHGLVSLDRSPRRGAFTKALLGLHSSFDRSMILLKIVPQVLDRPVAATAPQDPFLSGCTRSPPSTKTTTMRLRYARIRFLTHCVAQSGNGSLV